MTSIIITGQTAAGKTKLAELLQKKTDGEIISADSRAVYNQIPIGSGSYTMSKDIPYHLVDIMDIGDRYSVHDFLKSAHEIIDQLKKKNKQPIVCGGTLLFIERLIEGMDPAPYPDPIFRNRLKLISDHLGNNYLHGLLKKRDPEKAKEIHPSNRNILIRHLEKAYLPESNWSREIDPILDVSSFFITRDDTTLRNQIIIRTDEMLDRGLIEEARVLFASDLELSDSGLDSIGYDRIADYLEGDTTYEVMRERIIGDTFKLAKSQRKWIRRFRSREINLDRISFDEAVDIMLAVTHDV